MFEFFNGGSGWVALGVLLVTLESVIPGYYFLSFGIGVFLSGVVAFAGLTPGFVDQEWLNIMLVAAISSFVALLILKTVFKSKPTEPDINKY